MIVTFANGQDRFTKGVNRLRKSLFKHYKGPFAAYSDYKDIESPTHHKLPYAFKLYAIDKARKMGYKKVLWVDSITYAIKEVKPVFDYLEDYPILLINGGFSIKEWTNNRTLNAFKGYNQNHDLIIGGFQGYNFNHQLANDFFDQIMLNVDYFKGSWDNHRHDQSVISILASQMKIKLCEKQFVAYEYQTQKPKPETCFLFL